MRLDRFISTATGLSRKQVHQQIRAGAVQVNGALPQGPAMPVDAAMSITLSGAPMAWPRPQYWMLHKPPGYLCATTDGTHPTVLDLLDRALVQRLVQNPLQIVGRLDLDTTGLVLLTNDGAWNHRITAPNSHCTKQYRVTLAEPVTDAHIQALESGLWLRSETRITRPCQVQRLDERVVLMTLQEGRYHQVKRMFAAVGNRVIALHREQVGKIRLDDALTPGEYRPLTTAEIAGIQD